MEAVSCARARLHIQAARLQGCPASSLRRTLTAPLCCRPAVFTSTATLSPRPILA